MQITNYQEMRPAMRVPGKVSLARKEIDTTIICGVRTMFTTVVKRPSMKSPKKSMTPDKVPGKVMTPDKVPGKKLPVFSEFLLSPAR